MCPFACILCVPGELWSLGGQKQEQPAGSTLKLLNTTSGLPALVKQTLVWEGSSVFV